jgi:hypothetical protein
MLLGGGVFGGRVALVCGGCVVLGSTGVVMIADGVLGGT